MNDKSLISVIIPVYNGEKYLAEAVESVFAQTYRSIEVIIVDDGSTDRSGEISQRFGPSIHYILRSHEGSGAARNHGVAVARGTYCAFLDADDLWMEDKLTRQIAVFRDGPHLVAGTLLIKRNSFLQAGLFETWWRIGEFIDWYLKAIEKGLESHILPEVVMQRRLHGSNSTIRERAAMKDYVRILKASLDRRRASR
jgi:glycosyltransferase involved in cell wall biosynthesis